MTRATVATTIMIGTALLGATAGTIGTFAVLRRRALVGDMLSHAALPGVCLGFLFTQSRNLTALSLGALGTGLLGILAVTIIRRWTITKEDAAVGIVLSTFFAAGVVLLSIIQQHPGGNQAGLGSYLFGETAGITSSDIRLIAGVALTCLLIVTLLFKEFELLSFDTDFAQSQGWPTLALDWLMMGTLAVVTVVGLPICGVILMAALIIIPSATARFWTNRLSAMLVLSGTIGAASGMVGTWLASPLPEQWFGIRMFDTRLLPPGPLIVLSAATFFLASVMMAPRRGVLARYMAEMRLRARMVREHLLRALYEMSEPDTAKRPFIERSQLFARRSWSHWLVQCWILGLRSQGLIEQQRESVRLTPSGLAAAANVTRTHRLWELFLVESAGIASDHVDRDADDVEHMLSAPLIRELEQRLAAAGRLPVVEPVVPESPHDLL